MAEIAPVERNPLIDGSARSPSLVISISHGIARDAFVFDCKDEGQPLSSTNRAFDPYDLGDAPPLTILALH